MHKRLCAIHGATLIEVMGAVLIFMIGIAALLGVFYASVGMAKRGQYVYTAYNIAKNHIEELKSYGFTNLADANETESVVDKNGVADASGEYIRTTTVTNPYNGDSSLTEIDVKVWYVLIGTRSTSPIEVTTAIFENG
ncbi:MAG: hypothetical protein AUJ71_04470 [Candidatus Omnitrophica bacterium CG1_02_49_16]|nr:MAG: hypothetical protein AUJ71_04470 [Candidatus Omnitrophica bacterium CG1_02_49_16]